MSSCYPRRRIPYHLVNKLKGVDQIITREQAQTPEQQVQEYGDWNTIDDTQAKELAIQLGLASCHINNNSILYRHHSVIWVVSFF